MNDILAWQASDVGTGAADQLAFYDGRVLTFLGHRPGYVFSCFAATQHKILISLNLGHGGPPSDLSRFRQSLAEKTSRAPPPRSVHIVLYLDRFYRKTLHSP